jgi:hypothetical protein
MFEFSMIILNHGRREIQVARLILLRAIHHQGIYKSRNFLAAHEHMEISESRTSEQAKNRE